MVALQQFEDQLCDLSPLDRDLFFRFGIGESQTSPFSCIHHAFEYHALRQPNALAVVNFEENITYGELDRQANCLATQLRSVGVQADFRVPILIERSIWMVVAILGTLKAGAAYVPLDGNIVSDVTLAHALNESNSKIVLTLSQFTARIADETKIVIRVDDAICICPSNHCVKPDDDATTNGGAYVIYTSGKYDAYIKSNYPSGIFFHRYNRGAQGCRCQSPKYHKLSAYALWVQFPSSG